MPNTFSGDIDADVEVLRDLLGGIPAGARHRAKAAAVKIENVFTALQRENPKDPAVALGAAFAVFMLAQRLIQADKDSDSQGLIKLL